MQRASATADLNIFPGAEVWAERLQVCIVAASSWKPRARSCSSIFPTAKGVVQPQLGVARQ